MECPRCAAQLQERSKFCPQCGFVLAVVHYDSDAQTAGRVPHCRSCGGAVRAGAYPYRKPGRISPLPWNADWGGACEQCGFEFSMTRTSSGWQDWPQDWPVPVREEPLRRQVVARPDNRWHFQGLDDQLHLAGIEISVESQAGGSRPQREQCFLTKEEAAWLVRALQGALGITFEQYHWDLDVT